MCLTRRNTQETPPASKQQQQKGSRTTTIDFVYEIRYIKLIMACLVTLQLTPNVKRLAGVVHCCWCRCHGLRTMCCIVFPIGRDGFSIEFHTQ